MPRDLADVLHYFMPELSSPAKGDATNAPTSHSTAVLPILALPISDQDVVRTAFAWNLGVEISRLGGRSSIVTPPADSGSSLWPETADSALGTEILFAEQNNLQSLHRKATDVAVARAADADDGGLVLVRVPPTWLLPPLQSNALLRWVLLLTSPDPREMAETFGLTRLLHRLRDDSEIGVTFHGVKEASAAETAFEHLDQAARKQAGVALSNYGALLDDLEVYRAIAAHRAVGLVRPQSPAALALRDVATILLNRAKVAQYA